MDEHHTSGLFENWSLALEDETHWPAACKSLGDSLGSSCVVVSIKEGRSLKQYAHPNNFSTDQLGWIDRHLKKAGSIFTANQITGRPDFGWHDLNGTEENLSLQTPLFAGGSMLHIHLKTNIQMTIFAKRPAEVNENTPQYQSILNQCTVVILGALIAAQSSTAFKCRKNLAFASQLGLAYAVVDGEGTSYTCNDEFESLLGHVFESAGNTLQFRSGSCRVMLREFLKQKEEPTISRPVIVKSGIGLHLVRKQPLATGRRYFTDHNLFGLYVHHLGKVNQLPLSILTETFGLTQREAEVAQKIVQGLTIAQVAKMENVAPGTLRGQLKSIFRKTSVNSQLELAVLLRS